MTDPRFIAYVYPGWHPDPYRPGVDEWRLLQQFRPYFAGHSRPARPVAGCYDDTDPATAARQIAEAAAAGIEAFTFFVYYRAGGFVLDRPMAVARDVAATAGTGFAITGTWCVRLPHDRFPVRAGDALEPPLAPVELAPDPAHRPIHQLSVAEFEALIPEWHESWLDTPIPPGQRRSPAPAGPDTAAPAEPLPRARRSALAAVIADPAELTLAGLRRLVAELTQLGPGPSLAEVVAVLARHRLSGLPVERVTRLMSTVATLPRAGDPTAHLTLPALEDLLALLY